MGSSHNSSVSAQRCYAERGFPCKRKKKSVGTGFYPLGVSLGEETLVARIVGGLTRRYHTFVTNWSNSANNLQTMSELVPRLEAEETLIERYSIKHNKEHSVMFSAAQRGKKGPKNNKPAKRNDTVARKKFKCYNCGETGHFKKECKAKKGTSGSTGERQHTAEGIVAEVSEANLSSIDDDWILDSGASDHMSHDSNSFVSYDNFDVKKRVRLGDNNFVEALGSGDVEVVSKVGNAERKFLLKNVLYVPGLRRKLISIGAAVSKGCTGELGQDKFLLRNKDGVIVVVGKK